MKQVVEIGARLFPIVLGYLPIAVSFTLVATEAGLSYAEIIAMSILVVAAAAQLAAVPLIDGGYGVAYIAFITLLINFRHAALAATLSPSLRDFSRPQLARFSYGLTDEAFSVHALDIERGRFSKTTALWVNVGAPSIWILSTVVGCYLGGIIVQHLHLVRLEFALPAMFFGIITLFLKHKLHKLKDETVRAGLGYAVIVLATVALTWVLLKLSLTSLAYFVPALLVVGGILGWQRLAQNRG